MASVRDKLTQSLSDRYGIDDEIGRGGMATVFVAEDLRHHRRVAVKVLHPELALSLGSERFLREIRIAARLQHPHIVPLYDSGQAGELLYYVMPRVGRIAPAARPQPAARPRGRRARIARAIATALDYAIASRSSTATSSRKT